MDRSAPKEQPGQNARLLRWTPGLSLSFPRYAPYAIHTTLGHVDGPSATTAVTNKINDLHQGLGASLMRSCPHGGRVYTTNTATTQKAQVQFSEGLEITGTPRPQENIGIQSNPMKEKNLMMSGPISRILCGTRQTSGACCGDHSSGPTIARRLKRPTRGS